jgi:spermidine synthase
MGALVALRMDGSINVSNKDKSTVLMLGPPLSPATFIYRDQMYHMCMPATDKYAEILVLGLAWARIFHDIKCVHSHGNIFMQTSIVIV